MYLNETVREHSLYRLCPALLNGVSNRDYPGSDYFDTRIECLDMDSYEKKVMHKAQADNTVDAVSELERITTTARSMRACYW